MNPNTNTPEHSTFCVTVTKFFDPMGDAKSERKVLSRKRFKVLAERAEIIRNLNDLNYNIRSYYNQFHYSVSENETSIKGDAIQLDILLSKI